MFSSRTLVLVLGVAFIIIDQWVKLIALVALDNPSYVLGNQSIWLDLDLSLNPGAFLSLGAGMPALLKQLIFVVAVGAVCCWASVWAFRHWQATPIKAFAAWFIAVGGLSNLVLNIGTLHTGVFNLADIAIMAGAAVLMVDALTRPAKR